METIERGERLVELCKKGKNLEAVDKLYDKDVVSLEPREMPSLPATAKGLEAIRGKNRWFFENHDLHKEEAKGPFVNGDRFSVLLGMDVTPRSGEQKGKRTHMEEVAVYTVKNGRIVREEFFY